MTVAQRIKEIVDSRGITYTFISSKTGISIDAVSRSFSGKRRLSADEMLNICQVVGIDLCDLQKSYSVPLTHPEPKPA